MADKVEFSEEQQKLVDELVGTARTKAREKAQADHDIKTSNDKVAAEQAAMVADKKWQELYETSEAKLGTLKTLEKKVEAYEGMVAVMLKERVKSLGEGAIKAVGALPESMSAIEKLEWVEKNKELFQGKGDGVGTPGRTTKKAPDKTTKQEPISRYSLQF